MKSYGKLVPEEIAEKSSDCTTKQATVEAKRTKFLDSIFMDRAIKEVYGNLMSDLRQSYALGTTQYPERLKMPCRF